MNPDLSHSLKMLVLYCSKHFIAHGDWKHSWTIKVTGDAQMYKEENKKVPSTSGIIVIKSLVWPGAYILYQIFRNFFILHVAETARAQSEDEQQRQDQPES